MLTFTSHNNSTCMGTMFVQVSPGACTTCGGGNCTCSSCTCC